ncbi:acyl carrier protein [Kitasatospora sp. MAA19]|uniref:acyl carrier protein n=1 Tax=unclassified Kitasatospora TaxID=2633591 RepID=UPI002474CCA0|nr:acyl carrier protein [Kitasatospora sp. MAA19]MDH6708430.1 acyl carrier protein [Kitasatospora sp. MAA19]
MPPAPIDAVLAAASEVFGRRAEPTDDFFSLGGDSVAAVELAAELEERLGIEVDNELVVALPDLAALATSLAAMLAEAAPALSTPEH